MTKKENILIAEFMGIDIYDTNHDGHVTYINPRDRARVITLRYDEYNDLMPVVEKIREHTTVTINYLTFDKYPADNQTMVTINSLDICITVKDSKEAIYKAVVEFIKWYNKNK